MSKKPSSERTPATHGDTTRRAIARFSALVAKVVEEFECEPTPEAQAAVRPALASLLTVTARVAVEDANRLVETLPKAAVAALDRDIADLRVLEMTDADVLAGLDDLKDKVISLIKLLLPLIPKNYAWLKKLIEVILEIIQLLQKGD